MKKSCLLFFAAALAAFGDTVSVAGLYHIGPSTTVNHVLSIDTIFLRKSIFVDSGGVLTIDSGAVFKGFPAAGIVVFPGGKIIAQGTPNHPIIFTASADSMKAAPNIPDSALPFAGLWNGITIMGKAPVPSSSSYFYDAFLYAKDTVGGINVDSMPFWKRFGGTNAYDSSGVLQYLSIRYAGTNENSATSKSPRDDAPCQYNGLAFLGVGSKTTVDHIEVFKGNDWGFKFIGGSVQAKYLVSAFNMAQNFFICGNFAGSGQYWFGVGNYSSTDPVPLIKPFDVNSSFSIYNANQSHFANITLMGDGNTITPYSLYFENDSVITFCNSIEFGAGLFSMSPTYFTNKQWAINNNLYRDPNLKTGNAAWPGVNGTIAQTYWDGNNNEFPDKPDSGDILRGFFYGSTLNAWNGGLRNPGQHLINPLPRTQYAAPMGVYNIDSAGGTWFDSTGYVGAFDPYKKAWMCGWTALSLQGYLDTAYSPPPPPLPNPPALVSPVNVNTPGINKPVTLKWNESSGAAKYSIQVASDSLFAQVILADSLTDTLINDTTRVVSNLTYGSTYYWRVKALNSSGPSNWSTIWSFSISLPTIQPVPCLAPVSHDTVMVDSIRLAWNKYANIDKYFVQVGSDSSMSNTSVIDSMVTDTFKILHSLKDGQFSWWNVKAHSNLGAGWGSFGTPFSFYVLLKVDSIQCLSNNSVVGAKIDSVRLNWNRGNADVGKYCLQVCSDSLLNTIVFIDSSVTDTFKVFPVVPQSYWCRVKAFNKAGWGAFGNTYKFIVASTKVLPKKLTLKLSSNLTGMKTIEYSLPKKTHVLIQLIDVKGRVTQRLVNETLAAGFYKARLKIEELSPGNYILNFVTDQGTIVKHLPLFK